MDLSSLRIGFITKDGFECVTLNLIADHVGLRKNRLERAHKDLVAAGLITSTSRYERDENGNYKGLAAVRCISKRLFGMFGLAKMLKYEREKAYKKLKNKAKKAGKTITEICRFKPFFNSHNGTGDKKGHKPVQEILGLSSGSITCSDPPMSFDDKKRLQLRVIELYQKGNKNREECYKIARGELDL